MENHFKLYTNSPKHDEGDKDKQKLKIGDQRWQHCSSSGKIKVNGSENHPSKASEHQKYPSLHQALGPALTGFLCLLSHQVEN